MALNGLSRSAQEWVDATEQLTLRQDLRYLTLLTWQNAIPVQGLLRRQLAWCPICFDEMRAHGGPIYRLLLWTLRVVSICPRHKRPLQEKCPFPNCERTLPVLTPHSTVGFCPYCERWLGEAVVETGIEEPESDLWNSEKQIAIWVGEMLAAAPSLQEMPRRQSITLAIERALERHTRGNVSELARQLGVSKRTALDLRRGTQLPQLGTLIKLSRMLETTPLMLLTETIDVGKSIQSVPILLPRTVISGMRKFDEMYVRARLQEAVENPSCPPLDRIADELGYDSTFLSRKVPDLCSVITARHLAHRKARKDARIRRLCQKVRDEVFALHRQGIYPSKHRLARSFHKALMTEPAVLAAYQEAMRDLGYVLTEHSEL